MRSISYFSEIAFSGCETFKYVQCHPAQRSIGWCWVIAFQGRKIQICAVLSSNLVDLLILRSRVLRLGSDVIWGALSSKRVELLMHRNRVFSFRIFSNTCIVFYKRFMYYANQLECLFDDAPESSFQGAKYSNRGSAVHQWGRLATSRESRFHGAKCSNMSSAILEENRFADVQESHFRVRNAQIWAVLSSNYVDFLIPMYRVFRQRNGEIWSALSCHRVDLLMRRNSVFRLRKFSYW